nr:MAG TPA: hypothetical protein [Caudoviricetes sp.]
MVQEDSYSSPLRSFFVFSDIKCLSSCYFPLYL